MSRIGIIGCGMTGAVSAMLLKQQMPNLDVTILEKSRGAGGRMSTSRGPFGSSVDLGAQFFTKTERLTTIQEKCYNSLLEAGLLVPLHENIEGLHATSSKDTHFICPSGSGSLVKHFLHQAGCKVLFQHKVTQIEKLNNKWRTHCDNDNLQEFDALVLTVPVPQVLQLNGLTQYIEKDHLSQLKTVTYCSRYALGYFYKETSNFFKNPPWVAKFFKDDIIRFCSLDIHKRNADGLPSVAFHTTKKFGETYIDEDPSVVQDLVVKHVNQLLPEIPTPEAIKFHKWRYSQVENNYKGQGCEVLFRTPLLICSGDGFSKSNFEGCISSAENVVSNINKLK